MAAGVSKTFSGTAGKYMSGYGQFDLYIQFRMTETYDAATRKSTLVFSDFQIKAVHPVPDFPGRVFRPDKNNPVKWNHRPRVQIRQ